MEGLIDYLIRSGVIKTPHIIRAMRLVDRAAFVRPDLRSRAYDDIPLPTAEGQTISQPTTVGRMLEAIQPNEGEQMLDIGTGSGWVAALLAAMAGVKGKVVTVERIPYLVRTAAERIRHFGFRNTSIEQGDASQGWAPAAPYDVIHVAAATAVLPESLIKQLRPGGRLIIPIGDIVQDLVLITKMSDTTISQRRITGFQFVPLVPNHY